MRGFVPTPEHLVDLMVDKLFRGRIPTHATSILDPGCGRGAFIDGIIRWCSRNAVPLPNIVGVDSDPAHVRFCRTRYAAEERISIRHADFLADAMPTVDLVVGNPPYVPITSLGVAEKTSYRAEYLTARGRFDLYVLFFEKALRCLRTDGRLVFVSPEKFLYVESAAVLRGILSRLVVEELVFLDEAIFPGVISYPLVTVLEKSPAAGATRVTNRRNESQIVTLHNRSLSWQPLIRGSSAEPGETTLSEKVSRISCGVATGADAVFVHRTASLPRELVRFARPTVAGRELPLKGEVLSSSSLLLPYDADGRLLEEDELGNLFAHLTYPDRFAKLVRRSCAKRKPWYAFHESPPLADLLRPKILCKDIGPRPSFVLDRTGEIVPRHSVYYIVPKRPSELLPMLDYLNSDAAVRWLDENCQRAANGFVRLQSSVLKRLPVPAEFPQQSRSVRGQERSA